MSQVPAVLDLKPEDLQRLLACHVHLGAKNLNPAMRRYVWKRNPSGHHVLNLGKTWEKLVLAARVIVAVENPADVCVISSRSWGHRAVLKFAQYTGAHAIAGRYTPGSFTNQLQEKYIEPRLLVVTDPHSDHQPITEASYANIPTIAFCTSDSRLQYVDVAIPANNTARRSIGLLYWLLAREVLYLRGTIKRTSPWDVMVDLFFYRDDNSQKQRQSEEAFSDEFQRGVPSMLPAAGTVDSVNSGEGTGEWGSTDATATWLAGEGGSTGAAAAAAAWESVPAPADWSQDQTNLASTNPPAPDRWATALPATNWETPA